MTDTDTSDTVDTSIDNTMAEKVKFVQTEVVAFDYSLIELEHRTVVELKARAIKERIRKTAQAMVEIGEMLADVKAKLPHGQFTLWLQVEFNWDVRTAQNFMSVAKMLKNETSFVFPEDLLDRISIDQSALYILAARSTPVDVRREILERSYNGEPFTKSKVRQIVQERKRHRSNIKAAAELTESSTTQLPTEDFYIGDWVKILRAGKWHEIQGSVVGIQGHEIIVRIGKGKQELVRFYREELVKALPIEQGAQSAQGFYKVGDLAIFDFPKGSVAEDRRHNGKWTLISDINENSVQAYTGDEFMPIKSSNLDPIDNPGASLRMVAERVTKLLQRDDLDEFDKIALKPYLKRTSFTDRQIELLDSIWNCYQKRNHQ
jgi:hypothetical protein